MNNENANAEVAQGASSLQRMVRRTDPSTPGGVKQRAAEQASAMRARAVELEALANWMPDDAPKEVCIFITHALLAARAP